MESTPKKPAHQVIVTKIKSLVTTAKSYKGHAANGGVSGGGYSLEPEELNQFAFAEIHKICVLLETLRDMIIPGTELRSLIGELKSLDFTHAVLDSTIKDLEERNKPLTQSQFEGAIKELAERPAPDLTFPPVEQQ